MSQLFNKIDNMEEFEIDCDVEEYIVQDSEEWNNFLRDCEEWNEDVSYDDSPVFKFYKPSVKPIRLINCDEEKSNMIILGNVKKDVKIKKSFKFNVVKRIFCNSILHYNKQNVCNRKCNYAHSFEDVVMCNGKCGRITEENNFYTGICSKRHLRETLGNFMIRKNISIKNVDTATFELYTHPSAEFVQDLLVKSKNLFVKVILKIVEKPLIPESLEEFLLRTKKSCSQAECLSSEEFNVIWKL